MPKKAAAAAGKNSAKPKTPAVDDAVVAQLNKLKSTFTQELNGAAAASQYAPLSALLAAAEPPKKVTNLTDCHLLAVSSYFRAVASVKYQFLEEIGLFQIALGHAGVECLGAAIRSSPKLHTLELIECGLSATNIEPLSDALLSAPVPPLVSLRVDGNVNLGGEGIQLLVRALCLLPATLRSFHAANCGFGETGAERLAMYIKSRFCKLETLYLDHNSFGTRGICLIADAIANNQSLVTLSLTHNNFNDALSVRMMARALLLSSNLIDVNIDGNSIGDSGGSFLLEALRDTRRLQRLVVSPFMSHAIFTQIVDMFPTVQKKKAASKKKKAGGGKKKKKK